jgi:hypothetical protein
VTCLHVEIYKYINVGRSMCKKIYVKLRWLEKGDVEWVDFLKFLELFFNKEKWCDMNWCVMLLEFLELFLNRESVTPRITESLIKLIKLQLSLKARANQVIKVWNQNSKSRFEFEDWSSV